MDGAYEEPSRPGPAGGAEHHEVRALPDGFRGSGSALAQGAAHDHGNPGESSAGQRLHDGGNRSSGETRADFAPIEPQRPARAGGATDAGRQAAGGIVLRAPRPGPGGADVATVREREETG